MRGAHPEQLSLSAKTLTPTLSRRTGRGSCLYCKLRCRKLASALHDCAVYCRLDRIRKLQDITVPKADHLHAELGEFCGTGIVVSDSFAFAVLSAIQLDGKL